MCINLSKLKRHESYGFWNACTGWDRYIGTLGWDDGAMQGVQWCDARGTMVRCKRYDGTMQGYDGTMQGVRWCDESGTMVRIYDSAMQGVYTIVRYKGYGGARQGVRWCDGKGAVVRCG